jgi:hypothetical protein
MEVGEMKPSQPILILLTVFLICSAIPGAAVADVRAAPPPQEPTEEAIIQALEATARELGHTETAVRHTALELEHEDDRACMSWKIFHQTDIENYMSIVVVDYCSEGVAQEVYSQVVATLGGATTFHGYPASHSPPSLIAVYFDRFVFEAWVGSRYPRTGLEVAEIFYRHAVAGGFMVADGAAGTATPPTVTPAPTAPPGTATPTAPAGASITLAASKEGYESASQVIDNSGNLGTVSIAGVVRDARTGAGIEGAAVQIISGANPASTLTDSNGAYALVASVPGGQESGELAALDFELQLISSVALSLQADRTMLPADGVSTAQVTLRITDPDGNPLSSRAIDFTLRGDDGQGSIQPAQGSTDENGLLTATYTAFKPQAGVHFASNEHPVTITAADRDTGETTTLDLTVNQNQITVVGNQVIPACSQCVFPAQIYLTVRDAWGNPIPDAPLVVSLEGPDSGQGTLVTSAESGERNAELRLQTAQDGSAKLYYRWLGETEIAEAVQQVVILEEQTNALVTREIQVHGLDLAIARVEEAGFTGVTNQQAFLKIYFKDRLHPDLDLNRFNLDAPNQVGLRVSIYQFESEGDGTSLPFEGSGSWDSDAGGMFVKMHATPHMPYVIPVNDGTTWYEIRVDPVDSSDVPLPDRFRGNNDTIFALTTGSPEGWLHIWLSEGVLTPHSYTGVLFKCVARFLPGLGHAITAIDTLNQVYNTDVLGLGQSTSQVLIENVQRRGIKASTLNNVVSCMQDAYGVYKEASQGSGLPDLGSCARLAALRPAASYPLLDEDFDIEAFHHDVDQFTHGLLLDSPDQRAVVVFGLSDADVTLLDAQGQTFDDPDLVSAGSGAVVYILPAEGLYTLQVTTGSSFDIAVYQAGPSDGVRQTHRHTLQPAGRVVASMPVGGGSDYALAVDEDGDGAPDRTLQSTVISHDVVRPTITGLYPAPGSTLSGSEVTIAAEFADDAGGSGIDHAVLRVLLDGQDATAAAAIGADRLTLQANALSPGEHDVRIEVSDLEGNKASAEWRFTLGSGFAGLLAHPLLLPAAVGGGVLLFLVLVTLVVVLVWQGRSRRRPPVSMPQHRVIQDDQGRWWSQDPVSGSWFLWDGSTWRPWQAPGADGPPR